MTQTKNGSQTPQPTCVHVDNITVAYDDATGHGRPVLTDVSWSVPCGTLAAIIGPNGGGKSTLLRTLIGRLQPQAGTVRIFGRDPVEVRSTVSFLPQNEEIDWRFPVRVLDVVMQGHLPHIPWWRPTLKRNPEKALQALERVNLSEHTHRPIGDLSGGQRQRVLLARALTQDAQLILLDEPATALDATAQHDLLDILQELKNEGRTIVATTHDLNCLTDCFDLVLGLRGRVVVAGPPKQTLTPAVLTAVFGRHVPMLTPEGRVTIVDHDH